MRLDKNALAALGAAFIAALPSCAETWTPLFNGKNLEGWTAKFAGYPLGENHKNTFRVEDGILKVSYESYADFAGAFGHLFYEKPFQAFKLRLEYRFHSTQTRGAPAWALENSGVMVLAQAPETMSLTQEFPVSIEFQFLGSGGMAHRPTGSLCTPGTHVRISGRLVKQHCIRSSGPTMPANIWVQAEIHVLPDGQIIHLISGEEVLRYGVSQLDKTDADAKKLLATGHPIKLQGGYIALQAESHPVDFRAIEIMELAH